LGLARAQIYPWPDHDRPRISQEFTKNRPSRARLGKSALDVFFGP
jgi:hypothetical protein